jgi:hypothetical protein
MNKAREYSSPLINELLNEITPEEMEKTRLEMEAMIPKFKVGDKLKAIDYDREEYGLEYVTITSINEEKQVYHWEADEVMFDIGGKISSGYFFHEAIEYKDEVDIGEMINVWIEYHGYLDLDTDEQVIINFYNKIKGDVK